MTVCLLALRTLARRTVWALALTMTVTVLAQSIARAAGDAPTDRPVPMNPR